MLATSLALAFSVDVSVTNEAGIRVELPDQVGAAQQDDPVDLAGMEPAVLPLLHQHRAVDEHWQREDVNQACKCQPSINPSLLVFS